MMMKRACFVSLSLLGGVCLCDTERHLKSVEDLIQFSRDVNSGLTHVGTTVYLDSDLEFTANESEAFAPIGKTVQNSFRGVFDGQGNVVKNLTMSHSLLFTVGLFGYTVNATVKNTVLDSTCSIFGSFTSYGVNVGGLIAQCDASAGGACTVENAVSMAAVSSKTENGAYIGGIIGYCAPSGSAATCTVKNSANYGTVTLAGVPTIARLGGIVGHCFTVSGSACYVQNCLNYGTVLYEGIAVNLAKVGGIIGSNYNNNLYIDNCISGGSIVSAHTTSLSLGSIAGYVAGSEINAITHSSWTSDLDGYQGVGEEGYYANITIEDMGLIALDDAKMEEINKYAESKKYDRWFMLHLNGGRINGLAQDTLIVSQGHLPDAVKENSTFKGWFVDEGCSKRYDPKAGENVKDVYAKYAKVKEEVSSETIAIIVLSCVSVIAIVALIVLAIILGNTLEKLRRATSGNSERTKLINEDN